MVTRLAVVGSINLDLVGARRAAAASGRDGDGCGVFPRGRRQGGQSGRTPRPGSEAEVSLIGCVGTDGFADEALATLRQAGVDLSGVKHRAGPTGIALILVDAAGDNQIVVAPGANLCLEAADVVLPEVDGVLCQQEIPPATVRRAAELAPGRFFLNAAPARPEAPTLTSPSSTGTKLTPWPGPGAWCASRRAPTGLSCWTTARR